MGSRLRLGVILLSANAIALGISVQSISAQGISAQSIPAQSIPAHYVPAHNALAHYVLAQTGMASVIPILAISAIFLIVVYLLLLRQHRLRKQSTGEYEVWKRDEQQLINDLRQSAQRYHLLVDMSPIGICLTDPGGECVYVNDKWCEFTGLSPEEGHGTGWEKAIHPSDLQRVKETWSKAVMAMEPWEDKYRYCHQDGKIIWVWGQARSLLDENNKPLGHLSTIANISHIKEAESAINVSEAKFQAVVQTAALGIVSFDERGVILSINPAFSEITGYDEPSLLQRKLVTLLSGAHRKTFKTAFAELLSNSLKKRLQMTLDLRRRDGQFRTLRLSLSKPCVESGGSNEQIIAVVEDVTERLRLEEEISHAEKLESVGLLAGGIAHDFNNILTGIIGNLSLTEMNSGIDRESQELIREAQKSALRAQKLTLRLLTFSKGGTPVIKTMPVEEVVQDSALFALHGSNVQCGFEIEPNLDYVKIDEGQIAQVVHNLVINADQAMPRGGQITIKISNFRQPNDCNSGLLPGRYVKVDVSDEGVGIPTDYLSKIFDPFFSTKDTGSGLGLSTSYSILKKHGGSIKVVSSVGRGSTFSIFLPAAQSPRQAASDGPPPEANSYGTILVVDDERAVRDVTRLSLMRLGYDVVEATSGEEAIGKYRRTINSGGKFVVVLLDLTIPGGQGGHQIFKELKSIDSDVKAIVMSGYSTDPIMSDYRSYGFCGMIPKPFGLKELSNAISLATGKKSSPVEQADY